MTEISYNYKEGLTKYGPPKGLNGLSTDNGFRSLMALQELANMIAALVARQKCFRK